VRRKRRRIGGRKAKRSKVKVEQIKNLKLFTFI
jgi:hypothetical protein